MANLYFDESLDAAELAEGGLVVLGGDEARHAVRVSRLRAGERTIVGNGRGVLAHGVVETVDRDRLAVRIDSVARVAAASPRLVLVQALAKGDRDERAVEQATEFGVDRIVPWQAERSVSRWEGERVAKGIEKWSRIAREASKQSMRGWIPEVLPPVTLEGLCALAGDAHVLVLHPRGAARLSDWRPGTEGSRDAYLVVGPEGGFSDAELDALERAGATVLVLGETVLRTSSAGPAALAVLNAALGRW